MESKIIHFFGPVACRSECIIHRSILSEVPHSQRCKENHSRPFLTFLFDTSLLVIDWLRCFLTLDKNGRVKLIDVCVSSSLVLAFIWMDADENYVNL